LNGNTKSAILVVTYVWRHTAHTWALCTIVTRPEKTTMNKIYSTLFFVLLFSPLFGQTPSDCLNEICLETLHFDSVRLNSKIPLMLKDEELFSLVGLPDSIVVENEWNCGNYINSEETVKILYYGKSKFMSSQGTSLLYVLNLEEKRFTLNFSNVYITKGTTKSDLHEIFPNSLNSLNNKHQSYNKNGIMKVKMLQTPEGEPGGSGWLFRFNGEVIKEIELWWMIC